MIKKICIYILLLLVLFIFIISSIKFLDYKHCESAWSSFSTEWSFFGGCKVTIDKRLVPEQNIGFNQDCKILIPIK